MAAFVFLIPGDLDSRTLEILRFAQDDAGWARTPSQTASLRVDLQHDVHLLPVIELAHRLGIALVPVELGIHFVIDIQ